MPRGISIQPSIRVELGGVGAEDLRIAVDDPGVCPDNGASGEKAAADDFAALQKRMSMAVRGYGWGGDGRSGEVPGGPHGGDDSLRRGSSVGLL